MVRKEKLRRK